ncbi:MAG TPA: enoyl-CoA hydratase [Candidatus Binataceae bacterium]|nr:enoyl-CoA hydratase [Candidatus Binataceae bacterium]
MMESSEILLEIAPPLATLTFNRPQAHNALTWAMYDWLPELCRQIERDPSVRVMIVRGGGSRAFSTGTDITQFEAFHDAEDGLVYERRLERALEALEALPKPIIAAIEGYAIGAGAMVALACDLRYGGAGSKFAIPIARTVANCLTVANYARLCDVVGAARAKEIIFRGLTLDAHDALASGLLNAVVEADEAYAHARRVALEIAAGAPLTLAITKQAHLRLFRHRRHQIADEDLLAQAYGSADFHQAVSAFIAKRKITFQGR